LRAEVPSAPGVFFTTCCPLVEHLSLLVSEAEGQRDDRQRGVGGSIRGKHRGSRDEEVVERMDPVVGIHHSVPRICVHPRRAEVVM
jgi:hypothetical protein